MEKHNDFHHGAQQRIPIGNARKEMKDSILSIPLCLRAAVLQFGTGVMTLHGRFRGGQQLDIFARHFQIFECFLGGAQRGDLPFDGAIKFMACWRMACTQGRVGTMVCGVAPLPASRKSSTRPGRLLRQRRRQLDFDIAAFKGHQRGFVPVHRGLVW